MARHPATAELQAWLDGDLRNLDEHLAECEECAAELDRISVEHTEAPGTDDVAPALLVLLAPPDGLHERMSDRLQQRLQRRHDLELVASMLGVARETGSLFFVAGSPGSAQESRDSMSLEVVDGDIAE